MTIDRELVDRFLGQADAEIIPAINAPADRLTGHRRLIDKYNSECAAWHSELVNHVRGITEAVNELCIAKLILEDPTVRAAEYERQLEGTNKSVDCVVYLANSDAQIFYDVKTIQPEERDAWERYERARARGWFTRNTRLVLDQEWMGGEIAHELFASREKFLEYTLELEAKIRLITDRERTYFRLIFCGDGFQWRCDHLEDFADFYFNGHHRPDDSLGAMQVHYMSENGLTFERSIHGFCYFERRRPSITVTTFRSDVRGPRLPF